jgi:hypothetical protein
MYPSLPQGYKCLFHCQPPPLCLIIPPESGIFPKVLGLGLAMPCPGLLYPEHPHPRPLPYTKHRIQSTQIGSKQNFTFGRYKSMIGHHPQILRPLNSNLL